jgi:pyruvate formate lyase activating enzyme
MVFFGLCILAVPVVVQRLDAGGQGEKARRTIPNPRELKEASFYRKLDDQEVECRLCPRECLLEHGDIGDCQVKINVEGTLYSLVYGKPCSLSVEPIEKAPLFHFKPGHTRLCVATVGCNLRCKYCQNWQISQAKVDEVEYRPLTPAQVVELAVVNGVQSICFTFSEPIVFYEYLYDIAVLARERGLMTSIVSNGYINPKPLRQLLQVLDAVKIDLKAFSEEFYEEVNLGELEPVLDSLKIVKEEGVWLEIVNLVVPTLNDDLEEIRRMCTWVKEELGDDVPLHFTRFFPQYKLTELPATPVETLEQAYKTAREVGLKYVYIGNVPGHPGNFTFCPSCGEQLITRHGFFVFGNSLDAGRCPACGAEIAGYW